MACHSGQGPYSDIYDIHTIHFAKGEYKDILMKVYSLNVDEDNEEVHPPFICRDSCRKTLQADISNLKAFKQKKKSSRSKKPLNVIRGDFEPHACTEYNFKRRM